VPYYCWQHLPFILSRLLLLPFLAFFFLDA
jgi:hypothetical protein